MLANKLSFAMVLSIGLLISSGQQAIAESSISAGASSGNTTSGQSLRIAMLSAEAHFDTNTVTLTSEGYQSLEMLLDKLDKLHEILSVRIVGHTDNVGSEEFNKALSLQRANTIRERIAKKYANSHLVSIGMGESQPIAKNDTQAGRERNRRVEIQVIARGYMPVAGINTTTSN